MLVNVAGVPIVEGLVSVAIPAGRVDGWLAQAVDSVLRSGWEQLEVVVIVNGSEEDSAQLPADDRLKVERHLERLGVARANQLGIERARGEFVVHLDADDLAAPSRIAKQVAHLRANPDCVAVGSRTLKVDAAGNPLGEMTIPTGPDVRAELTRENALVHSAATFRASALAEAGGYDLSCHFMEDYELILRLALLGPIAILDEALTSYRIHSNQVSQTFRPNAPYVKAVMARRKAVARHLGIPTAQRLKNDWWYRGVQWGMYLKGLLLRKVGR